MSAAENKQLLKNIYDEMAKGNTKPFGDALADNVKWTLTGSTDWSKTYDGKDAVYKELITPLFEKFADQYTTELVRMIAEDDFVSVEFKGSVTTKTGKPYNNSYCYIYRFEDGKIAEITEYFDTELVSKALDGKYEESKATPAESADAILKLYELRRDAEMRVARQWFFSDFAPKSAMDIVALFRDGERASANFRMITSYWDTACSLVLNGAIDEKTFLDANTEHVFIYTKIQPFLPEIRELFSEPDFMENLETLVLRVPNIEQKIEGFKRLIKLWTNEEISTTA